MLPDLSVPPHWPETKAPSPCATDQDALRILNKIRQMIVAYRRDADASDWRYEHAQSADIVNVVAGLIADATAIDRLHAQAHKNATRMEEQAVKLREHLAESKRPFSAQMEMQNRRIIALTEELDQLRIALNGDAGR